MRALTTSKHPARDAWQGVLVRYPDHDDHPTTMWGCGHWHRTEAAAGRCAETRWPGGVRSEGAPDG